MSAAPEDVAIERLYTLLEEAVDLRYGAGKDPLGKLVMPDYSEGPRPFVDVLIRARQRADRIEQIMVQAKRVRRSLAAALAETADVAQDKMDQALADGAQTAREYSMGIERKAEASLSTLAEKRAERAARKRLEAAEGVVDALKDLHFGLSGWRNDVRDIVRTFQLESNLER